MNTHETEQLQAELNELNTDTEQKPQERQDVTVHVTGFDIFAAVKL